jgi:hypothetical protein
MQRLNMHSESGVLFHLSGFCLMILLNTPVTKFLELRRKGKPEIHM